MLTCLANRISLNMSEKNVMMEELFSFVYGDVMYQIPLTVQQHEDINSVDAK